MNSSLGSRPIRRTSWKSKKIGWSLGTGLVAMTRKKGPASASRRSMIDVLISCSRFWMILWNLLMIN